MLFTGCLLPMFTFEKFYIFNDSFSLVSGIFHLFNEKEFLLFVILFLFSIVVPVYKMMIVKSLINYRHDNHQHKKHLRNLILIGKWSMTDVFVVAIIAATVKLGALANVHVKTGLYIFALGVIGSMVLNHQVLHRDIEKIDELIEEKINKKHEKGTSDQE